MRPLTAYIIVAALLGLGVSAIVLSRLRPGAFGRLLRVVGVVLVTLASVGLITSMGKMVWDGGYGRAEYRITFQDANGRPVEGVELRVEDRRGRTFYHYPVTDFLPDRAPTSGTDGLMVFHHASDGVEFGGRLWFLFGFFPVEERPGPVYICRFLHRGQDVYRLRYSELDSWGRGTRDEVEKITRRWQRPDWPPAQLLLTGEESDRDYDARILKLFDLDGDGKLDAEEGAASHAGMQWRNEEAAIARLKGEDPEEEMEFPVVRRTVTIPE